MNDEYLDSLSNDIRELERKIESLESTVFSLLDIGQIAARNNNEVTEKYIIYKSGSAEFHFDGSQHPRIGIYKKFYWTGSPRAIPDSVVQVVSNLKTAGMDIHIDFEKVRI